MKLLPQHMLRLVSVEEREKMGKAGWTAEEALQHAEIKSERDLQKAIVSLLRLKGIEVNVSRMDKRKTDRVGWPDLTFCLRGLWACLWEVKLPGKTLDEAQEIMGYKLTTFPNGWQYRVITSVDQAREELRQMGIE